MCTTDVHDVRRGAGRGDRRCSEPTVGAAAARRRRAPSAAATVVVAATESADDERDASTHAPTTASTTTSTAGMANARGSVTGAGRYRRACRAAERSGRWDLR